MQSYLQAQAILQQAAVSATAPTRARLVGECVTREGLEVLASAFQDVYDIHVLDLRTLSDLKAMARAPLGCCMARTVELWKSTVLYAKWRHPCYAPSPLLCRHWLQP